MTPRWDRTKGSPEPMGALDLVREQENGEELVDLREVAPSCILLRSTVIPFLRQRVAEMLERAAQSLPDGVRLGVTDAWRPLQRQKRIYDWMFRNAQEAFPDRDFAGLKRTVNRWCHPYDRKAPPGHCTGAAVDVNLVDPAGEVIDVWSPYERWHASRTYTLGLDAVPLQMRMVLVEAMLAQGFSNCRDEWWHYSYGDAAWAVRTGETTCPYGLAILQGYDYEEAEREHEGFFVDRPNPFLTPLKA